MNRSPGGPSDHPDEGNPTPGGQDETPAAPITAGSTPAPPEQAVPPAPEPEPEPAPPEQPAPPPEQPAPQPEPAPLPQPEPEPEPASLEAPEPEPEPEPSPQPKPEPESAPGPGPPPQESGNGRLSGHAILAKLAWAMRSEPGEVRPYNEDFAGAYAPTIPDDAWDRGPLFLVCDGLGGHAAGEVASRTAVEAALAHWTSGTPGAPHQALRAAIRTANGAVFDAALQANRRGMATTLTGLTIAGKEVIIGHVGDSRCYLVRGQTTTQLTNDHSRVGEMLRSGLITPEQAANHPARSMISRTVGSEPSVQVEIIRQPTQAGDTFVLCSDGLWDVVGRREITEVVGGIGNRAIPTVAAAADTLIELALARNTPDNVTLLVVRITTDRPVPAARTRRSLLRRARGFVR